VRLKKALGADDDGQIQLELREGGGIVGAKGALKRGERVVDQAEAQPLAGYRRWPAG
jgi:hypothetical protein